MYTQRDLDYCRRAAFAAADNAQESAAWASVVVVDARLCAASTHNGRCRRVRWAAARTAEYCAQRAADAARLAKSAANAMDLAAAEAYALTAARWGNRADTAACRAGFGQWMGE